MSFFSSFSKSPSKADSESPHTGPGDFNMFGCNSKESGSGSFFGGAEDSSGGSFFGPGPSAGEPGGSTFSSGGFETPRKPGEQNPAPSSFGPPGDLGTPAKKLKPDPSQPRYQQPSTLSTGSQWAASPSSQPGLPDPRQTLSYGQAGPTQGRPGTGPHQVTPSQGTQAMYQNSTQAPAKQAPSHTEEGERGAWQSPAGTAKVQNINSSVQSSVLKEEGRNKPTHDDTKEGEDEAPADALLKDLIDMQKQQLCELLPEMRKGEEKSEQILDSARLVLKDVSNYGVKLAGVKQQYCSRLSQVSSFLRMIPKTENN